MKILVRKISRFFLRRTSQVVSIFCFGKKRRAKCREFFDDKIIGLYKDEIQVFIDRYPAVWSEEETIQHLLENKSSICRFGDGELKLMVGEKHKSFQDVNHSLNSRLIEVLNSNVPNILVAIHPVRDFDSLGRIWQKFIIRIGSPVLNLLDSNRSYPSMGVFRGLPKNTKENLVNRILKIKKLWEGCKILLVVGENSRFTFEEELFNNVESVDYVYAPAKNAFEVYDEIVNKVKQYNKDEYLVLIVLGPTATVMAYDLALDGYQAIDFGQMPGTYKRAKKVLFGDEEVVLKELL
ncbi:GT-D fold domain-containing glycosyltransferase [Neptunomonas phycophila]|uniref:GT-D fold domain-containing glycosyltransferase n=1 Tax=Neptunomonas phycophila TaxID=1572645 RepID=A0ABT9EWI4_9GAMM|nr:GT-D fold domain-containing glycosyltransferase [Neptunomonas phycophila]MDP2523381.1 GT-D fold domain-containing glycosyltransferase [Neptunomonas phycophila]